MSSRPILSPFSVITSGDMSSDIISAVTVIQTNSMVSYDISWVGDAPVGIMEVQVSNTYTQNGDGTPRNPGNWTTITLSTTPTVSGDTGNGAIDIDATAFYAIRLVYVATSGDGVMQAVIAGKSA